MTTLGWIVVSAGVLGVALVAIGLYLRRRPASVRRHRGQPKVDADIYNLVAGLRERDVRSEVRRKYSRTWDQPTSAYRVEDES